MTDETMLATVDDALTCDALTRRQTVIKEAVQAVMTKDIHYGEIPGTRKFGDKKEKLVLLKPGAESLMALFNLAADPQPEDLSGVDPAGVPFVRYRVKTVITSAAGRVVGAGVGECSSLEEKYKWRKAVCQEEYDETPEPRRRSVWKARWENRKPNPYRVQQVRTEAPDLANTILKMAKKRSQVDGVLTVTGASALFEQDLEERTDPKGEPPQQQQQARRQPRAKAGKPEPISESQATIIRKKLEQAELPEKALCDHLKRNKLEDVLTTEVNLALQWIQRGDWPGLDKTK